MRRYIAILAAVWLMLGLAWAADAVTQATVTVTHDDLNGHPRPDVHSPNTAWFPDGEVIAIYEIDGNWALTDGSEAGTCWVCIDYLTTEDAGEYTVTGNGRVRIRDTPDGSTAGWLKLGQVVDVYGVFDGWARVDGGWVMIEYLERIEENE